MERLEDALAKARGQRRQGRRDHPKEPRPESDTVHDWSALNAIEVTQRTAVRRRLGALIGGNDAAPFDVLRARVLRRMRQAGCRRLVVTSPDKGCGKSTISANLALSLTRQPDFRVMLFDFDLRRPALAKLFGDRSSRSIADLLQGRVEFADYALRVGTNLAVCTNHAPVRHPAELLRSQATVDLLTQIEAKWKPDMVIVDTPPMLGIDDTLGLLQQTDCALLVTAVGSTTLSQIDVCEQELSELCNVIGTVLNKCRYLTESDGYDYGYY